MNVYETSDLGLATTLSCLGYAIASLDRTNPRRVVFCFRGEKNEIETVIKNYWDGSLCLSPFAVLTHQKLLKQRIYSDHT